MDIFNDLIRLILLLGVVFYWLPLYWWNFNGFDDDDTLLGLLDNDDFKNNGYYMTSRFLTSTGILMACMGIGYVSLPVDAIPDWIPFFGTLDDTLARMVAGAGFMMLYFGYNFGTGDVPEEVQEIVTTLNEIYHDAIKPIWNDKVLPVIQPIIKNFAAIGKDGARNIWDFVLLKSSQQDLHHHAASTVFNTIMES